MKRTALTLLLLACLSWAGAAHNVKYSVDPATGGITRLWLEEDGPETNRIVAPDGSQYAWIGDTYGWGLGYFDIRDGAAVRHAAWHRPLSVTAGGARVTYRAEEIEIGVSRRSSGGCLIEEYVFTNRGDTPVELCDAGIYTPFNDNYPDAETCLSGRFHAHIWAGGDAAYANAVPMRGEGPCLGLALTEGRITGYDIWERSPGKGTSNTRGIIALGLPALKLAPGVSYRLAWKLFGNDGWEDFFGRLARTGSVAVQVNRYVFEKGEQAVVEVTGAEKALRDCSISVNGHPLETVASKGRRTASAIADETGGLRFDIRYGGGKTTFAECLVVSSFDTLLRRRADFIRERQQMHAAPDPRYGAYMVFDNETDRIYLNDTPNCSPGDRSEGAERLGMGVFLAKYCRLHPDDGLLASLRRYYDFVRRGVQDGDYNTWRCMSRVWGNRGYNYPWVAEFYFEMYRLTGEKQFALDGYGTMKALYRNFGHKFYAIGQPVLEGLAALRDAGLEEECRDLREDFIAVGDTYAGNGIHYPAHEVNFEQSIVAPAVVFLLELYMETKDGKYLDAAREQLPLLEAFSGFQPSYHLHDIGLRHWDGFWFGKREMWGDVFPHHWSAITAKAYRLYSECTGDASYRERAEDIVRNNLCAFFEDGRASCAYIYPRKVNGLDGRFYDPYANDQDWALTFFMDIFY